MIMNMEHKFQNIPTFTEFCEGKRRRRLYEEYANIKVEVDWWEDALTIITDEIHRVAGTPVIWKDLVNFSRSKFLVLGRETPMFDDEVIVAHLKDLIFEHYGDSIFSGEDLSSMASQRSAALGTKILVVSQLGDTLLHNIKVESGQIIEPEEPEDEPDTVASVSLEGNYDFEYVGENRNHVYGVEDYRKLLNEAVCQLQFDHYNTVLDKCLKDLAHAQEDGTLNVKKVVRMAKKEVEGKDDMECLDNYLVKLVRSHMKTEQIDVEGVDTDNPTGNDTLILKSAKNLFISKIVNDLRGRFATE